MFSYNDDRPMMIGHAAVSAKPLLQLTRFGQSAVSATPPSRQLQHQQARIFFF
jgi:hypothetical protein